MLICPFINADDVVETLQPKPELESTEETSSVCQDTDSFSLLEGMKQESKSKTRSHITHTSFMGRLPTENKPGKHL